MEEPVWCLSLLVLAPGPIPQHCLLWAEAGDTDPSRDTQLAGYGMGVWGTYCHASCSSGGAQGLDPWDIHTPHPHFLGLWGHSPAQLVEASPLQPLCLLTGLGFLGWLRSAWED